MKKADIGVALYLLAAVIFFIVPISSNLLDVMLALNISIALIVLFNTLFVKEVLDMSFFPTLLLFTTIFRISLNVSSTRLILTTGNPGNVVQTFGQFVGGGDLIVGAIVFIILVIIQFVVINKGSERVAEVTARFTLDAMPGLPNSLCQYQTIFSYSCGLRYQSKRQRLQRNLWAENGKI